MSPLPLFAQADEIPTAPLTLIERYGSFGLVAVIVLALVFYVFPKILAHFKDSQAAFTSELQAERKSREEQNSKCAEGHAKRDEVQQKATTALEIMCDRLERVENEVRRDKP